MKINGSLVFSASSAAEIQNLRIQKVSGTNPVWTSADVGRLIYNTSDSAVYIGGPASWSALATGGDAANLQTEVNALEASIGAIVGADGTFQASALTGATFISASTSITDALLDLDAALNSNNSLAALTDVQLGTLATGDFLRYNAGTSKWEDHALVLADISNVTASVADVNSITGYAAQGVTATEFGYLDATSSIQTQLNSKQASDPTLTALAAFNSNGIIVQTAADTFTARSLAAPAAGITITNPNGVAGNPTFALANDLAALEGLTTTGLIVRTADGTATTRAVGGTAGNIVVTNGDGVAGAPTINLASVSQAATGSFVKVTLDGFGRVTGNTAVVAADITALVDATYVNVAGDTMAGNLTVPTTFRISLADAPTADTHAANKAYVDSVAAGLTWKNAVHAFAVSNISVSAAPAAIDGYTLVSGNRVLLSAQTTNTENGIYVFNGAGSAMTRATDADVFGELNGAAVFVQQGTVYADTGWTQTATLSGFGGQTWSQFSGSALYTWGDGLTAVGNTVSVNMGAGIAVLPTDEVGIDVEAGKAVQLTSTATAGKLTFVLDAGSGLEQSATGLKISANGITNAMILNDANPATANSGSGSLNLGDTLNIIGDATQGTSVSVNETTPGTVQFIVTAANATSAQKGVASFDASHFSVTAGAVSLNATLDDLANVSSSDAAATGSILQKSAGDWVAVSAATVVGTTNLGDLADVGTAPATTSGQVLVADGTAWQAKKVYHLETVGTAATTWTVTHNIGQKYCNVTIVDATDEVVIPQSITFNTTTQLTVTFSTAVAGKAIVMGIA